MIDHSRYLEKRSTKYYLLATLPAPFTSFFATTLLLPVFLLFEVTSAPLLTLDRLPSRTLLRDKDEPPDSRRDDVDEDTLFDLVDDA